MKTRLFFLFILLAGLGGAYPLLHAGNTTIRFDDLPAKAQQFYKQYYAEVPIIRVSDNQKNDRYIVKMEENSFLIFDEQGEWIKVSGTFQYPVPYPVIQLLPQAVQTELAERYSGAIVAIRRMPDESYDVSVYVTEETTVPIVVNVTPQGVLKQYLR